MKNTEIKYNRQTKNRLKQLKYKTVLILIFVMLTSILYAYPLEEVLQKIIELILCPLFIALLIIIATEKVN